jgi:hypothetical protein
MNQRKRRLVRFCLLIGLFICWPSLASAHNLGRIITVSYATIAIIGSLMSGFGKISLLDHVGDPSRRIGKPVAFVIAVELMIFTLICVALVRANLVPGSIYSFTLIACSTELPLGLLVNWFFLTRPARTRLAFWVPCVLSITFPLALSLTSILVVPIMLEATGG